MNGMFLSKQKLSFLKTQPSPRFGGAVTGSKVTETKESRVRRSM
jgi:hypothetical protein